MPKLSQEFYQQEDVVSMAKQLLGKLLFTYVDGKFTGGIITETEAYDGVVDKACHAYGGRNTNRTATMFLRGGVTYVYLCYGIHHLLNVVSGKEGNPQAVLIRAIEPTTGIEVMLKRRKMEKLVPRITAGPGALSQALGIDKQLNAKDLSANEIWIEDGNAYTDNEIVATTRIGVAYAQEHALWPFRFYLKGNKFVSKPNS
ncbi:DNA-3-methyladenine glycosylase [Pedobacter xixiisoli]|uniref:Putative 3-methyladenine DNA glycosylase n=1 Tax=Pedobacter xixiisoli TaxID=1476464 RepID=A0A285ZU44_9SPHI|nr:DNA-3-methyladenine glycosylase [Pedobacter xixiisoli]SOD13160.1 DNA-3-methyladenine glycosylase [Pedobacter xixiisoli]